MKIFLSLILVCLLAVSIDAQSRSNAEIEQQLKASGASASVYFDANSKVTTLKGVAENFSDADTKRAGVRAMNFAIGALYAGDRIDRPIDPLMLSFWIMSGGKPRFGEDQTLIAVNGPERLDLGSGRYTARRDGMEYLNFNLTRDQVSQLANSSTWLIGGKQFTPTQAQKRLLQYILVATETN
ncbi:MAG TPA: hypothetical protein VFZ49_05945 [Pyrinomonadaceae bacterium]